MAEPATGVSGALGALENIRPPTGGGDSGSLTGAAQELSSAARGLQSVQGQIAGQTMAINQMSIAGQQQTQQLTQLVNQLNMSVGQLVGALNQMSQATRMAAMPVPPPQAFMPPPMSMGPAIGGFGAGIGAGAMMGQVGAFGAAAGDAAMGAARGASGLFAAGARAVGGFAGAMAAPFMPGTYTGPQAGQLVGSVGNAGMARSMMMGTGLVDLSRQQQAYSNAGEVQRLAGERGAFKMGEIMIGAGGGLASMGIEQLGHRITGVGGGIGGMAGGMIGGAFGGETGSRVGGALGTFAGGALFGAGGARALAGGPIAAALMAPINQTLEQVGQIRGGGEMYARNAFRMNAAGRGDRPTFRERNDFGRSMANEGTSDLLFNTNDMQQIFGGAIENDLMRGVGNAQQAKNRMRQLKEGVKVIGQTLGTSIQESMSLMGDLQGMGIAPGSAGKVMAGLNVSGLTRQEALQGQMSFMNRYQGTGLQGQGLLGLASQSQAVGQAAMRTGALSSEQITGAGGRAAVNQIYGAGMTTMMQGSLGTLNMAARMGAGSFGSVSGNPLAAMSQAGGAATTSNLIGFAANRPQNMRDMLADPHSQSLLLKQVAGIADQFKGMGNRDDIIKLVLKQQGVEDPTVFMALMKSQPGALREQMLTQQRALADLQVAHATENFSITGRLGRAAQSVTMPVAGGISSYVAGVQDTANNAIHDLRNTVYGIQEVTVGSGSLSVENLRKLKPDSLSKERKQVMNAKPSAEQIKKAKVRAFKSGMVVGDGTMGLGSYIKDFRESRDPEEREKLAKKILHKFSAGEAFTSPEMQKAYEQALSEQWGVDLSSAMNGRMGGLSKSDKEEFNSATQSFREAMDQDQGTGLMAAAGGTVGGILGAVFGPAGIAAGAAGGAWAMNKLTSGRGVSQATAQRMAQSDNVKAYLESVQKGKPDDELLMKVSQEGFSKEETMQLQTIGRGGKDKVAGVLKSMATMRDKGGAMAASAIMERAGGVAGLALKEAGGAGKDIAAALEGGTPEGIQAALGQLRGLSGKERGELLAKTGVVGDVLSRASQIHENMTLDDLKRAGVDEDLAKSVLGGSNKLTAEGMQTLQQQMVGQLGNTEGTMVTGTRGGFTQAQTVEQLKMSDNVMRTAELLRTIEAGLRESGFKVAPRTQ